MDETEYFKNANKFQRQLIETLKNKGFNHKTYGIYELKDSMEINVSRILCLSDALTVMFDKGYEKKTNEIKKALGI